MTWNLGTRTAPATSHPSSPYHEAFHLPREKLRAWYEISAIANEQFLIFSAGWSSSIRRGIDGGEAGPAPVVRPRLLPGWGRSGDRVAPLPASRSGWLWPRSRRRSLHD